jgi:hypothetical protein
VTAPVGAGDMVGSGVIVSRVVAGLSGAEQAAVPIHVLAPARSPRVRRVRLGVGVFMGVLS